MHQAARKDGQHQRRGYRAALPLLVVAVAGLGLGGRAGAAGLAGSQVRNTALVNFTNDGIALTQASNTADTALDEVLDVTVKAAATTTASVAQGATGQVLQFRVVNTGNGQEAFDLAASVAPGGAFTPTIDRIVVDTDGDGVLTAADTTYQGGATRPLLAPGQGVTVFVVTDIPANATGAAAVQLTATNAVGHGATGMVFEGKGVGGVDAVVGATGASANAQEGYSISGAPRRLLYKISGGGAEFTKSQTVVDPNGGSRAVAGSTITYTLDAQFTDNGAYTGVQLTDPLPAGVTYVAGSVKLDGAAVSDATAINAAGVAVPLGDLSGPVEHIVTFQVLINQTGSNS
jgi:uncharacterized repeat protein (TIGR01451 family)